MGEPANPFRATVGLRIVPAPAGSGVRFRLGIERGALPVAFQKAVEETVHQTLQEGLRGWQVTDAVVTLTHSGFTPPPPSGWSKWSSSAGDFRNLTPLVLMSALRQAGTRVYEPVHRFHLEAPADTAWSVLPALARLGAVPGAAADPGLAAHRDRRHPRRPGARADPAAAGPDARCGRPRRHLRLLPAGPRPAQSKRRALG